MNFLADRLNAGHTVQERARQIGIDHRTLMKLERDGEMPRPDVAKAVADFYGTTVTEMWPLEPTEAAA